MQITTGVILWRELSNLVAESPGPSLSRFGMVGLQGLLQKFEKVG